MSAETRSYKKRVIAMVYDFDGTLSPGSMQDHNLLPDIDFESTTFWEKVKRVKNENGSVEILTYMHLLQQEMQTKKICKGDLEEYGSQIPLFEGVTNWFLNINKLVASLSKGRVEVRHYILSSGLAEMLEGCPVTKNASKTFASSYIWEGDTPVGIARAITDASKPQYLFRIVKGREEYSEEINDHMPQDERPIPFSHLIFIGDGETDIPSMTVTQKNGGHALAVYDPRVPAREKKCKDLYNARRVKFYAPADYTYGRQLWQTTEIILKKVIADIRLEWADHLFKERVVEEERRKARRP